MEITGLSNKIKRRNQSLFLANVYPWNYPTLLHGITIYMKLIRGIFDVDDLFLSEVD